MKRERLTSRLAAARDDSKKKKRVTPAGAEMTRNLDGFEYDSSKATILKRALHNINVSLGTLLSAMKELSMLRGSEITPDGMLGGRGFIMNFREMKSQMAEAVDNLSNITDTIADELTNPKWGLSKDERKKVKEEKEEIDEQTEEIEETVPEGEQVEAPRPGEPAPEEPSETEEGAPSDELISPEDVKDSAEVLAMKRYKSCIEGNVKDKVAALISKNIMANLTK